MCALPLNEILLVLLPFSAIHTNPLHLLLLKVDIAMFHSLMIQANLEGLISCPRNLTY